MGERKDKKSSVCLFYLFFPLPVSIFQCWCCSDVLPDGACWSQTAWMFLSYPAQAILTVFSHSLSSCHCFKLIPHNCAPSSVSSAYTTAPDGTYLGINYFLSKHERTIPLLPQLEYMQYQACNEGVKPNQYTWSVSHFSEAGINSPGWNDS